MKLLLDTPVHDRFHDRKNLCWKLTLLLTGEINGNLPVEVNEGDDSCWVIDKGNNWRVKFVSTTMIDVICRYGADTYPALEAFCKHLEHALGAKIVPAV